MLETEIMIIFVIGENRVLKARIMEQKDRYIRFDWAVKRLLRNKANFGVLEGFLTVLLGKSVEIVEMSEHENDPSQKADDLLYRIVFLARNSKNETLLFEIQNMRKLYYLERLLYAVEKSFSASIIQSELYSEVKKVYSISILYFDIGRGNDYLYHGQNTFVGVHTGDLLEVTTKEKDAIVRKHPAEIFPEYFLIRVNEFNQVAVTPLEEWIEYLKTGIIRPDTKAPGLEEARRKLIYYNMDRAEQLAYDEHINAVMIQNDVLTTATEEGRLEGRAEGLAEGLEKGKLEEKMENARTMKSLNISTDVIHQVTGLSIEEINRL